MPTTKPLNKLQRSKADRAQQSHTELLRLDGAVGRVRQQRDGCITALLRAGVTEATIVNETGVPRTVVARLSRKLRTGA